MDNSHILIDLNYEFIFYRLFHCEILFSFSYTISLTWGKNYYIINIKICVFNLRELLKTLYFIFSLFILEFLEIGLVQIFSIFLVSTRFIVVFNVISHVKTHLSYLLTDKLYSPEHIIRKIHQPYYGCNPFYTNIVQIHSIHAHFHKTKDVFYS